MAYRANCTECEQLFPTAISLKRHEERKHRTKRLTSWPVFTCGGEEFPVPKARLIQRKQVASYLLWLSFVVDRINNTLHPRARGKLHIFHGVIQCHSTMFIYSNICMFFPGKWVKVDFFEVPKKFLQHLVSRTKATPHSVKEASHLRAPIISTSSVRVVYRGYSEDNFKKAMKEQRSVQLQLSSGTARQEEGATSAAEAIAQAKARAGTNSKLASRTSSTILIGEELKEFEIHWWPNLYHKKDYGKLSVRLFIHKLTL